MVFELTAHGQAPSSPRCLFPDPLAPQKSLLTHSVAGGPLEAPPPCALCDDATTVTQDPSGVCHLQYRVSLSPVSSSTSVVCVPCGDGGLTAPGDAGVTPPVAPPSPTLTLTLTPHSRRSLVFPFARLAGLSPGALRGGRLHSARGTEGKRRHHRTLYTGIFFFGFVHPPCGIKGPGEGGVPRLFRKLIRGGGLAAL